MTRHRPIRITKAEAVRLGLGALVEAPAPRRYPTAPVPDEHSEQAALIRRAFDRAALDPAAADLGLLFAIPNGGDRHPAVARKLQAEGVQPGIEDLMLSVPRPRRATDPPAPPGTPPGWWCGLFLEMKRVRGGRVAPEQLQWHEWHREQGYRVEVCYGAADAWQVLCEYLDLPLHFAV